MPNSETHTLHLNVQYEEQVLRGTCMAVQTWREYMQSLIISTCMREAHDHITYAVFVAMCILGADLQGSWSSALLNMQ